MSVFFIWQTIGEVKRKKEQEKATSESVKKQYQEQINTVEEAIAKKFEESKNKY